MEFHGLFLLFEVAEYSPKTQQGNIQIEFTEYMFQLKQSSNASSCPEGHARKQLLVLRSFR
jgi:hypothetical protein